MSNIFILAWFFSFLFSIFREVKVSKRRENIILSKENKEKCKMTLVKY